MLLSETAFALASAIGAAAFITSTAKISIPVRTWIARQRKRSAFWVWLHDLVNCPFCTSVWMALVATAIYRPSLTRHLWWPLDYLVTALAISGWSMLVVLVIRRAVSDTARTPVSPARAVRDIPAAPSPNPARLIPRQEHTS